MPDVAFPAEGLRSMPAPRTLRASLREATAEAHARLDAGLAAWDLRHRDDYRCFLQANAAAMIPLETTLERSGVADVIRDWPVRRRSAAIRQDIIRLGGEIRPLGPQPPLSRAGVLGALYVLEGSRLGARILAKTVESSPDPVVVRAMAYLRHGAGRPLWPRFLDCLERERGTIDEAELIAAARGAFALLVEALRQSCHHLADA